jgi:excinuclease ABC subunit B
VSTTIVEQVIRPTGLVDPEVVVRPTKGQIDDLMERDPRRTPARRAGARHDADQEDGEDLTDYLLEPA